MAGELDFEASVRERVRLLAGLPESALAKVESRLRLTDGAERLIRTLKALDYRVAILSGGFTWFAERLRHRLGLDYVHANQLEIADGRLTGQLLGPVVDAEEKARLLREIAQAEGVRLALPPEAAASCLSVMISGFWLEQHLDPEALDRDALMGRAQNALAAFLGEVPD